MSTTRLETFADGVFAIAATLLVLEIQLPGDDIGHGLVDLWPSYFAYALSFLTIGIMWVNHHVVLTFIREADRTFLFINLFLLMAVAFLPFPTGVFAEHIGEDGAREAAVAYGLTLTVIAIFFQLFWQYAYRRLLRPDANRREVSGINRSYLPGVPLYVTATLVALLNATASLVIFAAIALVYVSASIWGDEEVA
ncbi:MAG TPA: TMEM175 family protein [Gaiellaceae bacterium]|nr:TMEM175 family protein [Gaiellaceae bacterium]